MVHIFSNQALFSETYNCSYDTRKGKKKKKKNSNIKVKGFANAPSDNVVLILFKMIRSATPSLLLCKCYTMHHYSLAGQILLPKEGERYGVALA